MVFNGLRERKGGEKKGDEGPIATQRCVSSIHNRPHDIAAARSVAAG
jgi:hypothetical protein